MKKAGVPGGASAFCGAGAEAQPEAGQAQMEAGRGRIFRPWPGLPAGGQAQESGQGGTGCRPGRVENSAFCGACGRGSAGDRASAEGGRTGQDFPPLTGTFGGRTAQKSGWEGTGCRPGACGKLRPMKKAGVPDGASAFLVGVRGRRTGCGGYRWHAPGTSHGSSSSGCTGRTGSAPCRSRW